MKYFGLICFALCAACGATPSTQGESAVQETTLDPPLRNTDISASVQIYLPKLPIAVGTAFKTNAVPEATIKSTDGSPFKIVSFSYLAQKQALDETDNVVALLRSDYVGLEDALTKLNSLCSSGSLEFHTVLSDLLPSDLKVTRSGDATPPDPRSFSRLRTVFVYDFTIEDIAGKRFPIQIYLETFQDASTLG